MAERGDEHEPFLAVQCETCGRTAVSGRVLELRKGRWRCAAGCGPPAEAPPEGP